MKSTKTINETFDGIRQSLNEELRDKFQEKLKFGGGDYEGNWPLVKNPEYGEVKDAPRYIRKRQHE